MGVKAGLRQWGKVSSFHFKVCSKKPVCSEDTNSQLEEPESRASDYWMKMFNESLLDLH